MLTDIPAYAPTPSANPLERAIERARVVGAVISRIVAAPAGLPDLELRKRVRADLGGEGVSEFYAYEEIASSIFMLIRGEMITSSGYDRDTGCITIGADTWVAPNKALLSFAWRDELFAPDPDGPTEEDLDEAA